MSSSADQELIKGCIAGNREHQRNLYEQLAPRMMVIAMRYSKSQDQAEDILQDAFVKVFQNLKRFKGKSLLSTWVHKIVVTTALNYQRGKLYMFPMADISEQTSLQTADDIIGKVSLDELLGYVQNLPSGCQVIFNLYAIEGYKHDEIAQELGITMGTSKSQYSRAKKLLQERLVEVKELRYGNTQG